MNNNVISISNGNIKMAAIPSLSLPPVITCRHDAPCFKECYAKRYYVRRAGVRNAYDLNLEIYKKDSDSFFNQLECALHVNRYFRLNVSGDFPDYEYFRRCCEKIKNNPACIVLAFTKQYEIVNRYIDEYKNLPDNFKVILSAWKNWIPENPYNLPMAYVIFKNDFIPDDLKICGGNCFECACRNVGCWELKAGEKIGFYKH